MIYLTKKDIIYIHNFAILKWGGMPDLKNEGVLESCIYSPLQTFDSIDLYPSTIDKIIRLSYLIVCNHPFYDSNKRVAALVLTLSLKLNNINCNLSNEFIVHTFLKVANSQLSYNEFEITIKKQIN